MAKIRVVVVDDSALVRSLLTEIINRQPDMTCVGAAADPLVAREMIRETNPDVITLDVEMPRMDGLEFLSRLMRLRPMPVVMVSTLTEQGAEITLRALEMGAVDFVAKPRIGVSAGLQELAGDIVDKIRVAAAAHVRRLGPTPGTDSRVSNATPVASAPAEPARAPLPRLSTEKIICIGASTGGTEAIREVLTPLPADSPAIVITQHMPAGFTTSFANRLDTLCKIRVQDARDGQRILPEGAAAANLIDALGMGLRISGDLKSGTSTGSNEADGPMGPMKTTSKAEMGALSFAVDQDGARINSTSAGVTVDAEMPMLPFPIHAEMSRMVGGFDVPLVPGEESRPFGLEVRLEDLVVSPAITGTPAPRAARTS